MAFNPAQSLSVSDSLYIPPQGELERIVCACAQRAQSIWMIRGDYCMGKTSFLNAAAAEMCKKGVIPCVVDFCALTAYDYPDLLSGLAEELSAATGITQANVSLRYGTNFLRYLDRLVSKMTPEQPFSPLPSLALLLENLPELQKKNVLADFANLLVALVDNRSHFPGLYRVTVVITGGLYLEFLKESNLSSLNDRIAPDLSTTVVLPDLDCTQTSLLVQLGLQDIPWLDKTQMNILGEWIFEYTGGHPALIHSLGNSVHTKLNQDQRLDKSIVDSAAETLAVELAGKPGTFRRNLELADQKWHLLVTARSLVNTDMRYTRIEPAIRILEILGLIKQDNGRCVLRNKIFRRALEIWK
jgi:hypothetical protein